MNAIANYKPSQQNQSTITNENGKYKFSTEVWEGITYSCWLNPASFTAVALDTDLYLNLKFKIEGNCQARIKLLFNEGDVSLATLLEDYWDNITYTDNGEPQFAEDEYTISIKLSELGLTATDGKVTMTGWILNYILGSISFETFEIAEEPLVINGGSEESKPLDESVIVDESIVDDESESIEESEVAVESDVEASDISASVSDGENDDNGGKVLLIVGIVLGVIILAVVIILVARKKH